MCCFCVVVIFALVVRGFRSLVLMMMGRFETLVRGPLYGEGMEHQSLVEEQLLCFFFVMVDCRRRRLRLKDEHACLTWQTQLYLTTDSVILSAYRIFLTTRTPKLWSRINQDRLTCKIFIGYRMYSHPAPGTQLPVA